MFPLARVLFSIDIHIAMIDRLSVCFYFIFSALLTCGFQCKQYVIFLFHGAKIVKKSDITKLFLRNIGFFFILQSTLYNSATISFAIFQPSSPVLISPSELKLKSSPKASLKQRSVRHTATS